MEELKNLGKNITLLQKTINDYFRDCDKTAKSFLAKSIEYSRENNIEPKTFFASSINTIFEGSLKTEEQIENTETIKKETKKTIAIICSCYEKNNDLKIPDESTNARSIKEYIRTTNEILSNQNVAKAMASLILD